MEIVKTGNNYILYAIIVSDIKYYCISPKINRERITGFKNYKEAEETFKWFENVANKIDLWWENLYKEK